MRQPQGAEIFSATLIHPSEPLPNPHDLGRATFKLIPLDPGQKLTLWDGGEQRIVSSEPGTCEIEVTAPRYTPDDATFSPAPPRHAGAAPLPAIVRLPRDHRPRVQALAKQAVGGEKNPVVAAHKIERFVRSYITRKDLNIGFGSARKRRSRARAIAPSTRSSARRSDVRPVCPRAASSVSATSRPARRPRPSRKASTATPARSASTCGPRRGSGRTNGCRWDAALDGFDVGHIAITKSALEEVNPIVDLNAPVLQLMESLKIEIASTVAKADMPPLPAKTRARPCRANRTPAPAPAPLSRSAPRTRAALPANPSTRRIVVRTRAPRPRPAGLESIENRGPHSLMSDGF